MPPLIELLGRLDRFGRVLENVVMVLILAGMVCVVCW